MGIIQALDKRRPNPGLKLDIIHIGAFVVDGHIWISIPGKDI